MKIKGVAVYARGQQLNDTTAKSKRIQHTAFNGQLPMLYVRQSVLVFQILCLEANTMLTKG